jgi:stearoyl-CoA desaturase (delta-9 desaturase)
MGWIFSPLNAATKIKIVPDLAKFPELRFLDRFDVLAPIALGLAVFGLGVGLRAAGPDLGTSGMQMLVWGFFVSTVVLFHSVSTINSPAHLFGARRYDTKDQSRNNWILAGLTLGEGWHNNHHRYPTTVKQGFRWWELDVTFLALVLFSKLGLVWDLKPVPAQVLSEGRQLRGRPVSAGSESL